MKLRKINECLSNSLLNLSQVQEDVNAARADTVKSKIIIQASKGSGVLSKALLTNVKETDITNISPKRKPRRKRSLNLNKVLPNDESDNSFVDIIVPDNKFKISITPLHKGTGKQENKFCDTKSQLTENLSSVASTDSFKTPLTFLRTRKSFKSPIYTSSPKSEVHKRLSRAEPSVLEDNSFSSAIISSSDFKSSTSDLLTDNSLFSPIKMPNLVKAPVQKANSLKVNRKTAKPKVTRHSAPVTVQPIVRTRSGRESRSFSQTDLGKFIHEYLFEFYNRS